MTETAPWTVRRLLQWTQEFFSRKSVDAPRLSAELLLAHVLKYPRIKLYTDFERPLRDSELAEFRGLVQRAAEHEPIAYLTGKAHFFNLEFRVTKDVLIPRPDTETLVEHVLQLARATPGMESPRILDLCIGSGCIAAAIAYHLKNAVAWGIDISPAALEIARANIEQLGLASRVTLLQGDLYEPLQGSVDAQPFHVITANPPYIPTSQLAALDRSVRDYEPLSALDGGLDGLTLHHRILDGAAQRLIPGGRIYLEIAFDQGPAALAITEGCDMFEDVRILKDYHGKDRVLTARRKGPAS
jgi:release factor glutamine methyltransferase